jgi:uncharacterized protein YutE (UPF0331/DUF86 family)
MRVRDHLKSAEEFYEAGLKDYEEGRKTGNLTKMREGCEKFFHAYIDACAALIQKHGLLEPEDHRERFENLDKLGETKLIEIGDAAFLYLHRYGYYLGMIRPEVDDGIKKVEEAIRHVRREITRR